MSNELKIILVDDNLKEIKQFKIPKPKLVSSLLLVVLAIIITLIYIIL